MCKAFSAIVGRNKKVYWKLGIDGHEGLRKEFKLKDTSNFCPIEITPENNNYIDPNKWIFKFDDECPNWWKQSHEKASQDARKEWYKQLSKKLYKNRIRNLINPFTLPLVKKVNKSQIRLLKEWGSVWDSVGNSVWDSVWNSVWNSVGGSVGNCFKLKRSEWKYTEKIKVKGNYPFISIVKLWEQGLIPSFDGKIWRLHSGKKAKIVFEITQEELGTVLN